MSSVPMPDGDVLADQRHPGWEQMRLPVGLRCPEHESLMRPAVVKSYDDGRPLSATYVCDEGEADETPTCPTYLVHEL